MHPNSFLRTYWRLELIPQVFVAMSFDERYTRRFTEIIVPAVQRLSADGARLSAYRVDASKTGDSILTDIIDGVAHSQLILADVSTVGRDGASLTSYRNPNVLYEVGLALACRQPEEVLLVRDDPDRFLFDVSTIPHITIDFSDAGTAVAILADALSDRLSAQRYARDTRVAIAAASLTNTELALLRELEADANGAVRGWDPGGIVLSVQEHAASRLLDKGIIRVQALFATSVPVLGYVLTPLGRLVASHLDGLGRVTPHQA